MYKSHTKSIHYHHFVSIIDKNNRHLSGYDQISLLVMMYQHVSNHETTLALLKYEMTVDILKSKSTCLYEYKFEVL